MRAILAPSCPKPGVDLRTHLKSLTAVLDSHTLYLTVVVSVLDIKYNPSVTMQEHHVPPGIDQFVTYIATNTRSLPLPCWRAVIALPGIAGGCASSHDQPVSIASATKEIFHVQTATRR